MLGGAVRRALLRDAGTREWMWLRFSPCAAKQNHLSMVVRVVADQVLVTSWQRWVAFGEMHKALMVVGSLRWLVRQRGQM